MVMLGSLKGKLSEDMPMPMVDEEASMEGEVGAEDAEEMAPTVDLAGISDDLLLEEVKKRGLV